MNFVNALNNIIDKIEYKIESGETVERFRGNLANCTDEELIKDLSELRDGVQSREIRYVSIA
jgi:hypothetical protein